MYIAGLEDIVRIIIREGSSSDGGISKELTDGRTKLPTAGLDSFTDID